MRMIYGAGLLLLLIIMIFAGMRTNGVNYTDNKSNSSNDNISFNISNGSNDDNNYEDTLLVINKNSDVSKRIGQYFKSHRRINDSKIVYIDTVYREEISLDNFTTEVRRPIEDFLISNNLTDSINYIITTKGVPLKITDGVGRSVDSELTLILGPFNDSIGVNTRVLNPYFRREESFSRSKFGIYLVTRLIGYTYDDVRREINSASKATNNGTFVFDISPKGGGYQSFNVEMTMAANILKEKGYNVILDNTTTFLTHQENVLGYASWGSNDPGSTDHAIPHNSWIPGAIAETAVSSSARSFQYPTTYGQSLIADLIAEGVTGAKGYTSEPYLESVAHPDILFPRYVDGYNLAESYYMASFWIGWKDLVVGDPKTVIVHNR